MCSSLLEVLIGLLHETGELLLCDALYGEGHHSGRGGSAAHHLPATHQHSSLTQGLFQPGLRIRIRIHRIHMFLGLPDPDTSIIKQK